ncbi:MAG: hypothetical protein U9N83_14845 [Thermodesulfobacteriota bacterium]|nr:hypothetical protein [Thermodesulfobacteriota bacterium]
MKKNTRSVRRELKIMKDKIKVLYFIMRHDHCLGHKESLEWTVTEWIKDQQIELYNEINDLWVDIDSIFRSNPWGSQWNENPQIPAKDPILY